MSSRRDSDFARLEQLLLEERRIRQEAEERAERERRRAEEEQQRAEEERRIRIEEEKKTRRTTFEEYLSTCHIHLSRPLRIQTDKSLSTQGSITHPKNKPCPTLLKPWTDFPILQQQLFDKIHECIPKDARLFSSVQHLKELGQDLCDRPLASEKDLETYQRLAIERPTTNIVSHLLQIDEARRRFDLGEGITFENHANTLSGKDDEVQDNLQNDQICVYKEADGTRSLCMVVGHKSSHKLSVSHLRAGLLQADNGSMNIPEGVINRITIPTDPDEKFVYNSELLTVAALTQTYSYMIENGLKYSKLTTGEADIFLLIKKKEPHTLYYHLAEAKIEAEAQSEVDILLSRTAVSQNLTFCIMALDSKPHSQKWRNYTLEKAYKAVIDHEAILRQIPPDEKAMTPPPSGFQARVHLVKRSPVGKHKQGKNSCDIIDVHEDPESPSSSSDDFSEVETPRKPKARTTQPGNRPANVKTPQIPEQNGIRCHRQYCTQACLLGLVRGRPLDEACPNVSAHRSHKASNCHALEGKTLAQGIQHQLERSLDYGCEPLGKQGARGALFKLTLYSHGYTFVAKGTVEAFIPALKHEGRIYRHLIGFQGELIPVYLGNISLVKTYFLDFGVRIVHMLLMSWAGERAENLMSGLGRDFVEEIRRAVRKLLDYGVEHGDVRSPNVLWNAESKQVMLVDFERSTILKPASTLQEISPNSKRKNLHPNKVLKGYPTMGRSPGGL
ncbi:hypothetical protein M430DRAFT_33320 [Amorphotheca resinae ATCC 22711]|uniref:Protein kinase domain-containing protein n=1 Tax=Amorphotheca resinae ATCC 22711 TaxID=857342 RepID=A0A2T3BBL2_AMORE|nr:hypothetical protein M430DRAFT_33320 [Amorphotheca resinae ATCC 22711]PSS25711.1 hypothetical protein M430DRAFT_33320 [Amorphotheca resinae ATCC 22711]